MTNTFHQMRYLLILFSLPQLGFAQLDVVSRLLSLELQHETYYYAGNGNFNALRTDRVRWIGAHFDSAVVDTQHSILRIVGKTLDELGSQRLPIPNLQILVGVIQERTGSDGKHYARIDTRLRLLVDSLANFNESFRFYPGESLCFTTAEPVSHVDSAAYEIFMAKIYFIGKLIP